MTIEQVDVVDYLGVSKETGEVVLAVVDHLDWSDEAAHLTTLHQKLSTYLRFIESGELDATYPQAAGRPRVIEVYFRFPPTPACTGFLEDSAKTLEGVGIGLRALSA